MTRIELSDGVYITKTRSSVPCTYSDLIIEEGSHGILLKSQTDNGTTYSAWVALSSLELLRERLFEFSVDDFDVGDSISPSDNVRFSSVKGQKQHCLLCREKIRKNHVGILFYQRRLAKHSTPKSVWCHLGCKSDLVYTLGEAWDYTDEFLYDAF